ncbi:hypothetical protein niasHT_015594 [Heterodera trifolii]|uniref:Uncharacterized protein n=1 Tax=Heterodera trifolii TaxID=157864 RepID=A0ABD2LCM2_9BILA
MFFFRALRHFRLSPWGQSDPSDGRIWSADTTTKPVSDGRTDGMTDPPTDGQTEAHPPPAPPIRSFIRSFVRPFVTQFATAVSQSYFAEGWMPNESELEEKGAEGGGEKESVPSL